MADKKEKRTFIEKLKHKYRLIIYNDNTFEEVWYIRLSRINVFTTIGISAILLMVAVIVLIAFTPLKEFIPGFPDGNMYKNIIQNKEKVDSLENIIRQENLYLKNIAHIMKGEVDSVIDPSKRENIKRDSTYEDLKFTKSREDTLLREQVAALDQDNLSVSKTGQSFGNKTFSSLHFFTPVKGIVINKFNMKEKHYGVDIVAAANEAIISTLEGTVVMAAWTLNTGYVIQIQHENNLLSFYKHNSQLLKEVGDRVKAGETIAIIGNSGEQTTGPHLHFELWHNGAPINPESYIMF